MRKGLLPLVGMFAIIAMALIPTTSFAATATRPAKSPAAHIFPSRKTSPQASSQVAAASANANVAHANVASANTNNSTTGILTYHGGPVMAGTAQVYAIFWEPTGSTVSANYNSLIERYFGDVGSSPLYQNLKQYPQTDGSFPSNAVLAGSWVDTTAYPESPLFDSDIQTEVTNAQSANSSWVTNSDSVFFVFTAQNEGLCTNPTPNQPSVCTPDIATPGLCAYHNFFGSNNTIYAAIPYAASPSFNDWCNPEATGASGPNNDDADQTINVVSHEQMEAATDPQGDAWSTDNTSLTTAGNEVADLCAGTFGPSDANRGDVTWNNDHYIVQQEWDNAINGCNLSGDHNARYYELKNFNSNLVMDVFKGGTNQGAQVLQWGNKNGANQQWELVPDGSLYQIVNRNSGLVMDVFNGGINQGAQVIQWGNHHGPNQEWFLFPDGANDQIVNYNSGLVLDVFNGGTNQGAQVIQWPSHNGKNQQWIFTPVAPYYKIVNRNSGLVMDVFNGGTNAGAHVIQFPYKNGLNQQWSLVPDGTNNGTQVYQIMNLHSLLVLDVFNGGKTPGVNVIQWTNHNGLNQQWKLVQVPNTTYDEIVNVNSNLVMDVFNGGTNAGANVIQFPYKNGLNQQWSLVPTSE